MRSMHVIGSRRSGGAERFFLRLTGALARHGETVACVLPPNSELNKDLDDAVERRHVKMRTVFDPFARSRIASTAKVFGADVVQTYMGRATRLTHLPRVKGAPVHIARLGGYYGVKGYRHADAWVVNAHGIRDYLIDEGLDADRVFYIGNFVDATPPASDADLDALRASLTIDTQDSVLVCLGRFHRNKAFDVMLDALAQLPDASLDRPLRVVMVGDGPEKEALHKQAEALAVSDRVRWVGWTDTPERYLQLANLFVCPSRHEPLGNVVLEAWSAGVPVLASATGGLAELIDDGRNGALVLADDAEALAARVRSLLSADAADLGRFVREGSKSLESEHSESKVVSAYRGLYRQLTGKD